MYLAHISLVNASFAHVEIKTCNTKEFENLHVIIKQVEKHYDVSSFLIFNLFICGVLKMTEFS